MNKNTDYIFKTLDEQKSSFNPHEILQSFLTTYCQFNTYLQWLYSVQDLKELESRTYKNTIEDIMQKVEEYNTLLKGVKREESSTDFVEEDKSEKTGLSDLNCF